MIGAPDLLVGAAAAARPTAAARVRRAAAITLAVTAAGLGATTMLAATGWSGPGVPAATSVATVPPVAAPPTRTGAAPSDVLATALGSPWRLLELSLRPDGHATAAVLARFEAPRGGPARPEQLVASLAGPGLTDLAPVAIVATAEGTAVDLAGRLVVDTRRRPGTPVAVAALAGAVSRDVAGAGGVVRRVRTVRLEGGGTAASVAFDAAPGAAVGVLAALENGVSAPARMTGLLVRRVEGDLAVELTLTPRESAGVGP